MGGKIEFSGSPGNGQGASLSQGPSGENRPAQNSSPGKEAPPGCPRDMPIMAEC